MRTWNDWWKEQEAKLKKYGFYGGTLTDGGSKGGTSNVSGASGITSLFKTPTTTNTNTPTTTNTNTASETKTPTGLPTTGSESAPTPISTTTSAIKTPTTALPTTGGTAGKPVNTQNPNALLGNTVTAGNNVGGKPIVETGPNNTPATEVPKTETPTETPETNTPTETPATKPKTDVKALLEKNYLLGKENANQRYDQLLKSLGINFSNGMETLDASKRSAQQMASITYDRLQKYLPTQIKAQGLGGLGVSESALLQAGTNYMNEMGSIEGNYQDQTAALLQNYLTNKTDTEQARSDELTDLERAYNQDLIGEIEKEDAETKSAQDSNFTSAQSLIVNSGATTEEEMTALLAPFEGKVSADQWATLKQMGNQKVANNVTGKDEDTADKKASIHSDINAGKFTTEDSLRGYCEALGIDDDTIKNEFIPAFNSYNDKVKTEEDAANNVTTDGNGKQYYTHPNGLIRYDLTDTSGEAYEKGSTEAYNAVKNGYMNSGLNANERLEAFLADEKAKEYLGEYYYTLYDWLRYDSETYDPTTGKTVYSALSAKSMNEIDNALSEKTTLPAEARTNLESIKNGWIAEMSSINASFFANIGEGDGLSILAEITNSPFADDTIKSAASKAFASYYSDNAASAARYVSAYDTDYKKFGDFDDISKSGTKQYEYAAAIQSTAMGGAIKVGQYVKMNYGKVGKDAGVYKYVGNGIFERQDFNTKGLEEGAFFVPKDYTLEAKDGGWRVLKKE